MSDHGNGGGRSGEHFSEFMTRERDRLRAQREEIFNQQQELQRKLDEINREFAAIDAYEAAKTGKAARSGSSSSGRQQRVRRGSRREEDMKASSNSSGLRLSDTPSLFEDVSARPAEW